jgi:hypothetical protein
VDSAVDQIKSRRSTRQSGRRVSPSASPF